MIYTNNVIPLLPCNIKNRFRFTVGKEEGGMIWESSIETYTLPYIEYTASGNLLYDAKNPKQVFCNNLEVWDGEGSLRRKWAYVYSWLINVDVWQNQHNIVK